MKLTGRTFLLIAGAVGAAAAALSLGSATRRDSLRVVPSLDLQRYMGRWFEIAHLPVWFQRDCASDTTATYALRSDGKITVLNECRKRDGVVKQARGVARPASRSGPNSKLKVTFFWPFVGDYWVIDLDPEYRWAVVGEPRRRYLWILSREPQMAPEIFKGIVERAEAQGYALDGLQRTPHMVLAPGHTM